jgi:ketosteroid isomerase-like protein
MTARGRNGETKSERQLKEVRLRRSLPAAVFVLICLASGATAIGSANPHVEAADLDEFNQLEKIWNEAHLKGDAVALERLWGDDLQIIVPKMPLMTKSDAVSFARSGRMKFDEYTTRNLKVRRYGDTVVVTGEMKRSRRLNNGQTVDDNWHFTKVYLHTAGHWQVVIFQASELPLT